MEVKTHRTRNFIVGFSLSILMAWLILPRAVRHTIEPTASAAPLTFTVNVTGDGQDANPGDGICATGTGNCSLRAAIQEANANAGKDTINFNIPGAGVHTITPGSLLPDITSAVVIDGYSQPGTSANTLMNGDNAVLLIELNGSATTNVNGLTIKAANSTVQGLVINRFGTAGIEVNIGQGNTIQGNFIGTNPAGNSAPGNTFRNIIVASDNNLVGGTSPAARNVISGAIALNGVGPSGVGVEILFAQGNAIQGNFIGTDASGTVPLGNQGQGVVIESLNGTNLVGGTSPGARNVISGNGSFGIGAITATIQGNFIGTDVTGTIALGNRPAGVGVSDSIVGGSSPAARNIISGNMNGVELFAGSSQVIGNFIGTEATGTAALGNTQSGIVFDDNASGSTIGGAIGLGNTIAFNGSHGIVMPGPTTNPIKNNAILTNSIFSNGGLGINLGSDGVTPNDLGDTDAGPNNLQNFPVINSAITNGSSTTVTGALDSTPNTGITIQFFGNASCDPSGNGEGQTFVGSINQTTGVDGHFMFSATMMTNVPAGQFITTTATDSANNTSEFSQCVQVTATAPPALPTVQLSASSYDAPEGNPTVSVTITRSGDTSSTTLVRFATSDLAGLQNCNVFNGMASARCDYTIGSGAVALEAGETSKSFYVSIIDDAYAEGTEHFSVSLNNPSGATLGPQTTATINILDNENANGMNPIDNTNFFVRQHYLDFLGREPDPIGFAGWVQTLTNCGPGNTNCDRITVSEDFFHSEEFQTRGYLIYRFYPVSFGRIPKYAEFAPDIARVSGFMTDAQLEAAKLAFIADFMARPEFAANYNSLSNQNYIDTLLSMAGVVLPNRQALIDGLNNNTLTRAQILRQIVESAEVSQKFSNQAFVVMEYFGFLRRDPDALYLNWISTLDGGASSRTMVNGFLNSLEYRQRFGP